jgi:hypothetical protein
VGGARLGEEGGTVDDDPGDATGADESTPVALEAGGGHGEDEPPALDLDQRGLGQDDRPHGHGRQVVELHAGGHARLRLVEMPVGGPAGGLLAQGDEPGRGQHRHVARPEVLGGVLGGDGQLELGTEPCVRSVPRGGGRLG